MTSPHPLAPTAHPLDTVFVLHARPLRAGAVLEDTARFVDDTWRLAPAIRQQQRSSLILPFTDIPARYKTVAKELCYAMLSGDLPPGETRSGIDSIHRVLRELKVFLAWLHGRVPAAGGPTGPALADLTGTDLLDYQRHLMATCPSLGLRDVRRAAVRRLWRYRTRLSGDPLPFDPRHLDGWGETQQPPTGENATDRIPEQVHGPLLAWALRFVDNFAGDILAAEQQRRRRNTGRPATTGSYGSAGRALRDLLDEHLTHRRPLPGHRGKVNLNFLAGTLGCSRRLLSFSRAEIDAVAAVTGVSSHANYDIPIRGYLDDQPWLDGIHSQLNGENALPRLSRMLQAACYVTISFQSGMRDSEIKHLRRGCLRVHRDADDRPYRWKVQSLAFKGERDPAGVQATWVVGEPASRAILVLEQLQPPDTDLLFAAVASAGGAKHAPTSSASNAALTSITTNTQLNDLVRWINDYCDIRGRVDKIPLVERRPWRLSTSQFRRTLAWFIARRPGGAIAGAIVYRHLSVQMFEGYAGTSDSGFRAEVESEQALARGEQLLAMIDAHEHTTLAGPAAEEAARRLEQLAGHADFQGRVVTDDRRLQRLMRRDDPAIYPSRYVTCVHTHTTALCRQRRDSRDKPIPNPDDCRPLACRNVALASDNIAAWHAEINHIDRRLAARPPLPPLLQHQQQERRQQIILFLARHQPEKP